MSIKTISRLDTNIRAVCPIDGVSVGVLGDISTVRIDFKAGATNQQKTDAQTVVNSFDWSDAAQLAFEDSLNPTKKALDAAAAQAIQDNTDFLALTNPNNAQITAQVKKLTQQNTKIIQRLIQLT